MTTDYDTLAAYLREHFDPVEEIRMVNVLECEAPGEFGKIRLVFSFGEYITPEHDPHNSSVHQTYPELRASFGGPKELVGRQRYSHVDGFGVLTVTAPEAKRLLVAETCARANWPIMHGSFQLDMSDGQIRFHASCLYLNQSLSEGLIRPLVSSILSSIHVFESAFAAVARKGTEPRRAVEEANERWPHLAR